MDDSDVSSETSNTALHPDDADNIVTHTSIVQDLTDEDRFLSNASLLSSSVLKDGPLEIKPRPYQLEMFQESLKRNIVVAMDTGSGKTHM
jgi:superfamily II DNA or RNA helicase